MEQCARQIILKLFPFSQITGEYENVQNALSLVTRKLRDNLFPTEVLNDVRARSPHGRVMGSPRSQQSTGLSFDSDRERSLRGEMDQLGLSNSLRNASSSGQQSPKVADFPHFAVFLLGPD